MVKEGEVFNPVLEQGLGRLIKSHVEYGELVEALKKEMAEKETPEVPMDKENNEVMMTGKIELIKLPAFLSAMGYNDEIVRKIAMPFIEGKAEKFHDDFKDPSKEWAEVREEKDGFVLTLYGNLDINIEAKRSTGKVEKNMPVDILFIPGDRNGYAFHEGGNKQLMTLCEELKPRE